MTDSENLVARIKASMKEAMKARAKERLATIRLIQAEFKRVEVDERIEIDDLNRTWTLIASPSTTSGSILRSRR
jgi:uncharacterized protein YqeY